RRAHRQSDAGRLISDHGRLIFVAQSTIWRPATLPFPSRRVFRKGLSMTDPDLQKTDPVNPEQTREPVVSKPYVMPDDPEGGSIEAVKREAEEMRDKMLRTLAEMVNLRRRTSREVADARTYGITGFARDVLEIADNLQRALDAVPGEAKAAADPGLMALIEGVELTERSLLNALE